MAGTLLQSVLINGGVLILLKRLYLSLHARVHLHGSLHTTESFFVWKCFVVKFLLKDIRVPCKTYVTDVVRHEHLLVTLEQAVIIHCMCNVPYVISYGVHTYYTVYLHACTSGYAYLGFPTH